ncbi:MAG: hypothetical protein AAFY42_09920 [Pseudomonadota bacterium]
MIRAVMSAAVLMTLAACAGQVGAQNVAIVDAQSEEDFDKARQARWSIEVYSGGGIPGSPGASVIVSDYHQVLQSIVDRCKLGRTVQVQATDGVSLLAIMNDDLSQEQLDCIKESEQPGLRLKDWGTNG